MFSIIINILIWTVNFSFASEANFPDVIPYKFGYGVNDLFSGDTKEHRESTSENGRTEGEYRWMQPNGLFRVVRYYVDGPSGFIAEVTEEEEPRLKNYMFSNFGIENIPLSASHSQNRFSYKNREGINLSPQRQVLDAELRRKDFSLQYNEPLKGYREESFIDSTMNQNNLAHDQPKRSFQGSQIASSKQFSESSSLYFPSNNVGQESIELFQEPNAPVVYLKQNSLTHQESTYNINQQQQSTRNFVSTPNFISNNNVQQPSAQNIQAISGTNPPINQNSKVNPAHPLFESLKKVINEKSLETQELLEYDNDQGENTFDTRNFFNPQKPSHLYTHNPNVLHPDIIKELTGKINLLPLESTENQLINPKVVTSEFLFSEKNKFGSNDLNEDSSTTSQNVHSTDLILPLNQRNILSEADTFAPLRLNSGARIIITSSTPLVKATQNRGLSKTHEIDINAFNKLRSSSNEELMNSDVSSYSNLNH